MKNTGIVRRIDELGRIVIPKEIRKVFKIDKNEAVEMFVDGDSVVLKKFNSFVDESKLKTICKSLADATTCPVVIASKESIHAYERIGEGALAKDFLQNHIANFNLAKTEIQTAPKYLSLFNNKFEAIILSPVTIDLNCEFIIYTLIKTIKQTQTEIALATLAASIASKL